MPLAAALERESSPSAQQDRFYWLSPDFSRDVFRQNRRTDKNTFQPELLEEGQTFSKRTRHSKTLKTKQKTKVAGTMSTKTGYDDAYHNHCHRQLQLPAVVACGYRHIQSTKSQLTFPAWLVAIRRTVTAEPSTVGEDHINTSTVSQMSSSSTTKNTPDEGIQLVWRSKRDWLLLGRKSKKASLPKAALKKLADTSASSADIDHQSQNGTTRPTTIPWTRPFSFSHKHHHNKDKSRYDESSSVDMIIQQSMTEMKVPSSPNHFRPEMKKSLQQLDQFLQLVEKEAVTDSAATDTLSLSQDRIIDQPSVSGIASAWNLFCRIGDTEGLIVDEARKVPSSTRESMKSSKLGQYFASETNAKLVAKSVLRSLDDILLFSASHSNANSNTVATCSGSKRPRPHFTRVEFVEPSCGNGDILVALLAELKKRPEFLKSIDSVSIFAYDVDPNVLSVCEHRVESMVREDVSLSNKIRKMEFTCQDFLTTIAQNDDTMPDDGDAVVCCLGGPPYTTGAGSTTSMSPDRATASVTIERDLPERFVFHCQMKWSADIISFLMPERYRKMDWGMDSNMVCATDGLPTSTFFFRGNREVTQPSILQTFIKEKRATTRIKRST